MPAVLLPPAVALASSRRFKEEIKPMEKASESILALKPVTFRYKKDIDPSRGLSFGLIAEEVAEVNPELITRDQNGNPQSVRYEAINAMLLNEFLKEHRKVEEQGREMDEQKTTISQLKRTAAKQEATIAQQREDFQATLAEQQTQIRALTASLKEQASQIQKVSAKFEAASSRRALRTALNDQ
jgi:septal ring factor EnvC (AmiA/AmiB activator)